MTTSDTGKIRWIGYVEGHQQGKIQVGDKVIGLAGVEDHLVYRESEKALVVRLSTKQSTQSEDQMRMAKVKGSDEVDDTGLLTYSRDHDKLGMPSEYRRNI